MNKKVLLVDGHSIMNRAFYGVPLLSNSEGMYTNAVYGFLTILIKTLNEEAADYLAVAFDVKAPTFRHVKYEAYKGNRKGMPDELRMQIPLIKEVLEAMKITIYEVEGFEADDVLGTIAKKCEENKLDVTVLSGDRDLLQLATEHIKISIPKTKGGTTITENYFWNDVIEKYQVNPIEFIDLKGLMGDTSDNIPGVPGIGEKTATKIIKSYKTIENAYEKADELKPPRASKNLKEFYDQALLSKELATICTDCEIPFALNELMIEDIFTDEAYHLFKQLEFKSLVEKHFNNTDNNPSIEEHINLIEEIKDMDKLIATLDESAAFAYSFIVDETIAGISIGLPSASAFIKITDKINTEKLMNSLKPFFEKDSIIKITHDLKKDYKIFDQYNISAKGTFFDCSIAGYTLNPSKDSYDVDDIANEFLNLQIKSNEEWLGKGKSKKQFSQLAVEEQVLFAGSLAYVLFHAYDKMIEELKKNQLEELYNNIELPLIHVLYKMETLGIKLDQSELKAYSEKLGKLIDVIESDIYDLAGVTFNINSPKQLGVILFEKLELPIIKKTKTGYSTAVDVLEKLKNKHPIISKIIEYRHLSKLKSTYADGLFDYIADDSRIHSTFKQTITSTGRISSTDPNLQNIPIKMEIGREIRKVFIPEDGYVFVDADYSQIELRLLAHLSSDDQLINAYNNNEDIHRLTASQVFHVPFDEVTSLQRSNAKAVNFGIVYGISAFGLSQDLNISRKEADDYINNYFKKYPSVKIYLDNCIRLAKDRGFSDTMFGRKRPVPELKSRNFVQRSFGERVAMNTPIQGSAADIIKIAMINVQEKLQELNLKSRLILQVHDELLIEAHESEVDVVKELLVDEMENAVKLDVPLKVDVNIGCTWFDTK